MKTTLNTPFSINPDIKGVFDADGEDILGLSDDDDAELVRVVNQHDQLTAINQELVEALDHVVNKRVSNLTLKEEYSELIKRAKELTNEG